MHFMNFPRKQGFQNQGFEIDNLHDSYEQFSRYKSKPKSIHIETQNVSLNRLDLDGVTRTETNDDYDDQEELRKSNDSGRNKNSKASRNRQDEKYGSKELVDDVDDEDLIVSNGKSSGKPKNKARSSSNKKTSKSLQRNSPDESDREANELNEENCECFIFSFMKIL